MDTLFEAIKTLLLEFNELCEENNVVFNDYNMDEEYIEDDNSEKIEDIYDQMVDNLLLLERENYDSYLKYISLLSLEYFNLYYEDDDEIVEMIKQSGDNDEVASIISNNSEILYSIIEGIVLSYYDDLLQIYDYSEFIVILNNKSNLEVYKKLHPNMKREFEKYKQWKLEVEELENYSKIEVKSLTDFVLNFCAINPLVEDKDSLAAIIMGKMYDVSSDLFKQIYLYMYEFAYRIIEYKKRKNIPNDFVEKQLCLVFNKNIEKMIKNKENVSLLILEFMKYDIIRYNFILEDETSDTKKYVKSLDKYRK